LNSIESEIDLQIINTKHKLKELKDIKRQSRKLHKLQQLRYKPPVYFIVNDIWDTLCCTLLEMVKSDD